MRALVGIGALVLAAGTGYLALSSGLGALIAGANAPSLFYPLRGLAFALVMGVLTAGLVWLAVRSLRTSR